MSADDVCHPGAACSRPEPPDPRDARIAALEGEREELCEMMEQASGVIEAARVAVMAAMPAPADAGHDMPMIRDMAAKALYDALIAWDGNKADALVRRVREVGR